jgi:tetratricopeptide (TPR) repeat protein
MGTMKRSTVTTVLWLLFVAVSQVGAQGVGDEWDVLIQEAGELYRAGQNDRAEAVARKALDKADKDVERGHPDVATRLDSLATVYLNQAEYALAEPLLKRALSIKTNALGPDHPDVAWSLNTLATVYYIQSEFDQAEESLKRALAIWEEAYGPGHPIVANSLSFLAELYRATNRDEEAEILERRVDSLMQEPVARFMDVLMSKLAPGEEREVLEQGLDSGKLGLLQFYESGAGICRALASGSTQEQILDASYYHYWGVAVSDAMYEAALEVLCPELEATGPDKMHK